MSLPPGDSKIARFSIQPEQLQVIDENGEKQYVKGKHTLHIGGISPGKRGEELTGLALKTVNFELR